MPTNGRAPRGRTLPGAAEELVRSLVGVKDAHVHVAPDGTLDTIDVIADASNASAQLPSDVVSALIAVFGISLAQDKIRVGANGNGANGTEIEVAERTDSARRRPGGSPEQIIAADMSESLRTGLGVAAVLVTEQGSENICHVSVRWRGDLYKSAGLERRVPGREHDLVARVTLSAVQASQAVSLPVEFVTIDIVDIGGNACFVAALRIWSGQSHRLTVGSSIVRDSYPYAAAMAVVSAVHGIDEPLNREG